MQIRRIWGFQKIRMVYFLLTISFLFFWKIVQEAATPDVKWPTAEHTHIFNSIW